MDLDIWMGIGDFEGSNVWWRWEIWRFGGDFRGFDVMTVN